MAGRNVSMDYFAFVLSRLLDRNVIDKTGLAARYDVTLDFVRELPVPIDDGAIARSNPDGPNIFQARKNVGLRLQTSKGPVDFLVIDSVEKPSEN
jgi:uncharacterized protein (TIGR03435 family)